MLYVTKVWNRQKKVIEVYERNGDVAVSIGPDEIINLETENPETLYARFAEVIFEKDGGITFATRDDFPKGKGWEIELLNREGTTLERRILGNEMIILPRGIPIVRFLGPEFPEARFSHMAIQYEEREVKSSKYIGYYTYERVLVDKWVERSKEELLSLKQEVEALGKESIT